MMQQFLFDIKTTGRGMVNITNQVNHYAQQANVEIGLCNIFLRHTSASLVLCENFDPLVQDDMEAFMNRLVPDGDALFKHTAEGPDDMPSHVRSILTQSFLTIPVSEGKLALGTWQGVYLWEHRVNPHHRKIVVTIL